MEPRTLTAALPAPAPPAVAVSRAGAGADRRQLFFFLFVVLHAPLAELLQVFSRLPAVHALATLGLGVFWATLDRRPALAVSAAAYIAGAEVLWRMTGTGLFWELGKYGASLVLLLVLVQLPSHRTSSRLALLYFALLLPSAALTLQQLGLSLAKDGISFNLSGPFSLAVAVVFFSSIQASSIDLEMVVASILAPSLGVLAICATNTLTTRSIQFYAESNYVTSGGFGPNQVSAILGLGALLSLLMGLTTRKSWIRIAYLGLAVAFLVQGVLTFSRGGVLNAVICIGFLGIHLVRQPRVRVTVLVVLTLITFLGTTVIFPRLNDWTGGALEERYTSTSAGLRKTIVEEELELFLDHPLAGVGPGMSKYYRSDLLGFEVASHTEFTRLLSEHGALGLLALVVLLTIALRAYLRAPTSLEKAWVAAFSGWAFIEMSHSAMRIMAISLLFGLATIQWRRPPPE